MSKQLESLLEIGGPPPYEIPNCNANKLITQTLAKKYYADILLFLRKPLAPCWFNVIVLSYVHYLCSKLVGFREVSHTTPQNSQQQQQEQQQQQQRQQHQQQQQQREQDADSKPNNKQQCSLQSTSMKKVSVSSDSIAPSKIATLLSAAAVLPAITEKVNNFLESSCGGSDVKSSTLGSSSESDVTMEDNNSAEVNNSITTPNEDKVHDSDAMCNNLVPPKVDVIVLRIPKSKLAEQSTSFKKQRLETEPLDLTTENVKHLRRSHRSTKGKKKR